MSGEKTYTAKEIAGIMKKSTRAIEIRAKKENWPLVEVNGNGRGGKTKKYPLSALPSDIQNSILIYNKDTNNTPGILDMLPALSPASASAAVDMLMPVPIPTFAEALAEKRPTWTPETAISPSDLRDPRIKRILAILREVDAMPRIWTKGRRKYIETVALGHNIRWQTIYKWIKKYEKAGIAGIRHTKSYSNQPRKWTLEAVDHWVGMCLKREHRHMNRKDLYDILLVESDRRNWDIGGYESANWWYEKRATPLLIAYRDGGARALDNMLPPVVRDYSDLDPFEILVGDQHRFDFWVVDDVTGEVIRPEGYLWQDLRTRIIYGAALDRRYDSNLIGLALRIGMRAFGAFKAIYTDNGKPELARYITGILSDIHNMGLSWETTVDYPMDVLDTDTEDLNPCVIMPGTHKKAIVKNAKAKMIEGTFNHLEGILRSRFRLPGNVKDLHGEIHAQDIDQADTKRLAETGKLPLASEFMIALYRAIDYYNQQKHHRGLQREWHQNPRPAHITPFTCLKACYTSGWRPVRLSDEAADLIFLSKAKRMVRMGRIELQGERYEHDALLHLHGERVDVRYNPIEADTLLVFRNNKYICAAHPVEYSSMKDMELAERKIVEKRRRRKEIADIFRDLTKPIPDLRQYSEVPELEKVAAVIGDEKRQRAIENAAANRVVTQEEIDAHIAKMEAGSPLPAKAKKPLPERPGYFMRESDRYFWIIEYEKCGGALTEEDRVFAEQHETQMSPSERDRWQFERSYGS